MFTRKGTVLALMSLLAAGTLAAATSYQVAYVTGTSGPAAGGTAVAIYGNQFVAGATVTVGGAAASASRRQLDPHRRHDAGARRGLPLRRRRRQPGQPERPSCRAPGSPTSSTCRRRAPSTRRSRRSSATGSRRDAAAATTARASSITRAQMAVFLLRAEHGSALRAAAGLGHDLRRRRRLRLRRRLDRAALRRRRHGRRAPPAPCATARTTRSRAARWPSSS